MRGVGLGSRPNSRHLLQAAHLTGMDRLDAQLLLLHALGKPDTDRAWLLAHDDDPLAEEVVQCFHALSRRRLAGEPVAYLVGRKEFFGLALQVDARVLVPRPDTETLVQWALDLLRAGDPSMVLEVLDLGTGSGAIALAIAHRLQLEGREARVVALDASAEALEVARGNAARLALKVQFVQSHWFAELSGTFHLIASNPPYIAEDDPHLVALTHEPRRALTAGISGLDDLREIVMQASQHLHPGGWLLLEHGHDQADAVRQLLSQQGFSQVQNRCDLAGIERCGGGQWRH